MTAREQRKLEHLRYASTLAPTGISSGFADVHFLHNCLSTVNPEQVDLRTKIADLTLPYPIFIDALTGGVDAVTETNRFLARLAAKTGMAMAVGSQYGTVREHSSRHSFEVVRQENPDGVIFANVSALATPAEASSAIDMLGAAALEVHLNIAQELFMREGDRDFASLWTNLLRLRDHVQVPIIVKETGCGMAAEQISQLLQAGFTCLNVAGAGGTSFPAIEAARSGEERTKKFGAWGIPTVWSLLAARRVCPKNFCVLASGGIDNGVAAAKALALGSAAAGMAGILLKMYVQQLSLKDRSETDILNYGVNFVQDMLNDLRDIMVLTGCKNLKELQQVRLIFTGSTWEYLCNIALNNGGKFSAKF